MDRRRDLANAIRCAARVALRLFALGAASLRIEGYVARDVHTGLLTLNRLEVGVVGHGRRAAAASEKAHHESKTPHRGPAKHVSERPTRMSETTKTVGFSDQYSKRRVSQN